jgi:ATP-dependent RNA helicase DDX21
VFFERRDAPKASDVGMAASRNAAKDVRSVPAEVTEPFMEEATALVEAYGAEEALARALAWIAGVHQAPKPASLITGEEGMTTLLLRAARLNVPRAVAVLAQASGLSSKALGKIKAFNGGVAADVPTHAAAALVALEAMDDIKIELATVLPELIEAPVRDSRYNDSRPRSSGGSSSGNNRFQGNRDNYRPSNSNSSGGTSSTSSSTSSSSTSNASNSNSGGASRGGFSSGRPSDSRGGESRGFRARKKY